MARPRVIRYAWRRRCSDLRMIGIDEKARQVRDFPYLEAAGGFGGFGGLFFTHHRKLSEMRSIIIYDSFLRGSESNPPNPPNPPEHALWPSKCPVTGLRMVTASSPELLHHRRQLFAIRPGHLRPGRGKIQVMGWRCRKGP